MESIVITPRNGAEMKFVSELLSKIGLEARKLDDETKENMGLAFLMSKVDRKDIVDLDEFKKSLK
jgi:hypothetical protein